MCFSATTSFISAGLLLTAGTYGAYKAQKNNVRFLPLLTIPLFFGIQQFFEGMVWIDLMNQQQDLAQLFAYLYLFFAFFFWPFYIPLSVCLVERKPSNKKILQALLLIGALLGFLLYSSVFFNIFPLHTTIFQHSIRYQVDLPFLLNDFGMYMYCIIIVFSLGLSSLKSARWFAALVFVGIFVSLYFYYYTFTSVWCFFSAVVSLFTFKIAYNLPKRIRN